MSLYPEKPNYQIDQIQAFYFILHVEMADFFTSP